MSHLLRGNLGSHMISICETKQRTCIGDWPKLFSHCVRMLFWVEFAKYQVYYFRLAPFLVVI